MPHPAHLSRPLHCFTSPLLATASPLFACSFLSLLFRFSSLFAAAVFFSQPPTRNPPKQATPKSAIPTQPPTNTSHCQPHFTIFWLSLLLLPSLFWTFRLLPSPLVFGPRPAFLFFSPPPPFFVCAASDAVDAYLCHPTIPSNPPLFLGVIGGFGKGFSSFFFCSALFRLYFLTGENVWPSLKYDTITRSWGL